MLNASWCLIFQQNNLAVFVIAQIVCIGMLWSAVHVMKLAVENRLNVWEIIGMRCGFTVYAGWLTVATTLNVGFVLKAAGLNDSDMSIDESWWAVATLIIVQCVYGFVSFMLRNPLYSCVLEWALFAIMQEQESYSNVVTLTTVLVIANGCYIVALSVWMILDKINNFPNEKTGLFY